MHGSESSADEQAEKHVNGDEATVPFARMMGRLLSGWRWIYLVVVGLPFFVAGYGVHALCIAEPQIARIKADAEATHETSIVVERELRRKTNDLTGELAQERRWKNDIAEKLGREVAATSSGIRGTYTFSFPRRANLDGSERSRESKLYGELVLPEILLWSKASCSNAGSTLIGKLPHGTEVKVLAETVVNDLNFYLVRGSAGSKELEGWVSELLISF